MPLLITQAGLIGVSRAENTPAQQSIATAFLGVGLMRAFNDVFPPNDAHSPKGSK